MIVKITKDNFNEVMNSNKKVLLDFWAPWCGPCRMLAPVLEDVEKETSDIVIGKINVDEEGELSAAFNVMSIPTMVYFKEGKVVSNFVGYRSKDDIKKMIND